MLLCISLLLIFASGITPFFLASKNPLLADRLCAFLHVIGSIVGLSFAFIQFTNETTTLYTLPFTIFFSHFSIFIDTLSLLFFIPIFTISSMSVIYSLSYWSTANKGALASIKYRFFVSLFTIFMILLVISDSFMMLLVCWEIMSLLAYALISSNEVDEEAQNAGFLYLIATHTGIIALLGMFAIIQTQFGFLDFSSAISSIDGKNPLATWVFLLGLFGFGIKAGFFPLYFWLPSAHSNAPVPISALLSGVMIKMGIYGILKIVPLFFNIPPWWGWLVFGIGIVSGILGVVYAIAQHDIKKLLAYHSIENIGIITIGIGLALLGKSYAHETLVLFGLGGAAFHIINHALFKSLLFYSAGSIIEKFHTRDIGHYGGIIKVQPYTALFFLIGAVAICGIPPLNGFASEWLLYMGMFKSLFVEQNTLLPVILGILALALIGGLALACFVKVFGISFLGKPRKIELDGVKESHWSMLTPMFILSLSCFLLGLFPSLLQDFLKRLAELFNHKPINLTLETLHHLSEAYIWFFLIVALIVTTVLYRIRGKITKNIDTWACGFAHYAPKTQYTPASLMQMLMELFGWALHEKKTPFSLKGIFVQKYHFYLHQNDKTIHWLTLVADSFLLKASKMRSVIHNGYMGIYVLYIFIALVLMLLYVGH